MTELLTKALKETVTKTDRLTETEKVTVAETVRDTATSSQREKTTKNQREGNAQDQNRERSKTKNHDPSDQNSARAATADRTDKRSVGGQQVQLGHVFERGDTGRLLHFQRQGIPIIGSNVPY